jgi:transposase-like protein
VEFTPESFYRGPAITTKSRIAVPHGRKNSFYPSLRDISKQKALTVRITVKAMFASYNTYKIVKN